MYQVFVSKEVGLKQNKMLEQRGRHRPPADYSNLPSALCSQMNKSKTQRVYFSTEQRARFQTNTLEFDPWESAVIRRP